MIRLLTASEFKDLQNTQGEAGFGALETAQGCLPLASLDVEVQVEGMAARTSVRQDFRNVFDEPLEATYIFPLPARAAVTGFRMLVNDAVIDGRIHERAKARTDYDAAIADGRTASIVEQERDDVFTLRVGNIPPRSTARIELTLVAPVAIDSLEATYRFPLVVAPRYCPGAPIDGDPVGSGVAIDTDRVPDASRISPPVLLPGFKSPVRLGIRVRIGAGDLAETMGPPVACTLAAEEARNEDGSVTVTLVPEQRLDRDFILRWGIGADAVASTTLLVEPDLPRPGGLGSGTPTEAAPGDGTFSLVIVPPAESRRVTRPARDVVFMLDRSGSMGGWKMVAARRAVARMIDSLGADDRLAVVAFDNSIEYCGTASRLTHATDRQRWSVLERLGGIEARGGTELAAALKAGFGVFVEDGTPEEPNRGRRRERLAVLVTDCQVGDEDRVLADLGTAIGDVTFFAVGIDTAVNEGLLARIADATGGLAEIVESEDRLDEVMERIQHRMTAPLVRGLGLQPEGLDIIEETLVPARLPGLVPGLPVVVRGRYRGSPAGAVRVEGRESDGKPWQMRAQATVATATGQGSLWAKGRLGQLVDQYMSHRRATGDETLAKRIVDLSTSFGVLCRFTAIVAIDPRQPDRTDTTPPPRQIVQPVECIHQFCSSVSYQTAGSHVSRATGSLLQFAYRRRQTKKPASPTLADLRLKAAAVVRRVRPRSGRVADVRPYRIFRFQGSLAWILRRMKAAGATSEQIDSLALAFGRLFALREDRDALVVALDALATFSGTITAGDCWWRQASGMKAAADDVPA